MTQENRGRGSGREAYSTPSAKRWTTFAFVVGALVGFAAALAYILLR